MSSESTLWMGDLQPWMNEFIIKKSFIEYGFYPKSIKFIKDKKYNINQHYCFINFDNILEASKALTELNGKQIPNTKMNFKLNWANKNSEKNVYVGNLPRKVTDVELYNIFKAKFPSVFQATVVMENGISKKFGFVYFLNEEEYQKCLKEMDGAVLYNNIIRVKERKKKNNGIEHIQNLNNNSNLNFNKNIFYQKINNNNHNINDIKMQSINLKEIKEFFPKIIKDTDNSKFETDDTTFSSQEKEQDLSILNSSFADKKKFSENIQLMKNNNNKLLYQKAQESINKAYEYCKSSNRIYDISNMLLYYITNSD
jgi:RNA recognition motif-containing protein